jgi:hypothetical protein
VSCPQLPDIGRRELFIRTIKDILNLNLVRIYLHRPKPSMKPVIALAALLVAPQSLVQQIADSGRCADLAETPDQRLAPPPIAPGPPPLISFRYYEGKQHHRFGNAELMLDDAGH